MTKEQLQAARAAHWRQKQNPILTLEDAEGWVEQHPLCLYLPRHAQLPAPAPSFVEACIGSGQATPGAAAMEQARGLLARLIASGTVVPLNLFGVVGEQADFLAHRQALPSVLALRGDSDWKHAPQKSSGHKVSPLVLELWKTLDEDGGLTAVEAREKLGRELTEAAVLRGLCELWQGLRISPVFGEAEEPARWELLRVRHRDALTTAGATGQVTALSLLVSMYLQSVYAASGEEIEIFLSPVASRSRVREAVRGLSATRQIHSLSMDAQTYYFLENGLPEFGEPAVPPLVDKVEIPRRPSPVAGPRPVPRPAARPGTRPGPRPVPPTPFRNAPAARPVRPASAPIPAPAARTAAPRPKPGKPWVKKTEWKPRPASGEGRISSRPSARPEPKPGNRPGGWPRDQKQARPTPWARPGQGSAAPRSPQGPGDRPFRSPQRPRPVSPGGPQTASGNAPAGRERFPSRPPRESRGPGDRSRTSSYRGGGRPKSAAESAATPGVNRPSSRPPNRPFRPGSRPGPRPGGARPSGPRPGGPRSSGPRPRREGATGERPSSSRPPSASISRASGPRASGPGASRPKGPGRGGPPKSWPRAGTSANRPGRKPGKPSGGFRGRKPDRKKPGV